MKTVYHRDGKVTYWSVYNQVWARDWACSVPVRELAAMGAAEGARVIRHAMRHFGHSDSGV